MKHYHGRAHAMSPEELTLLATHDCAEHEKAVVNRNEIPPQALWRCEVCGTARPVPEGGARTWIDQWTSGPEWKDKHEEVKINQSSTLVDMGKQDGEPIYGHKQKPSDTHWHTTIMGGKRR